MTAPTAPQTHKLPTGYSIHTEITRIEHSTVFVVLHAGEYVGLSVTMIGAESLAERHHAATTGR